MCIQDRTVARREERREEEWKERRKNGREEGRKRKERPSQPKSIKLTKVNLDEEQREKSLLFLHVVI